MESRARPGDLSGALSHDAGSDVSLCSRVSGRPSSGGAGTLPQTQQLFFGELVLLTGSGPLPPLSTLLSLLEQASERNDEDVGGAGALPQTQQLFLGELVILTGS